MCRQTSSHTDMILFVEKITEYARKTPDKTALVGMGEAYTYQEFDGITDVIAQELMEKGLTADMLVAIEHKRHVNVFFGAIGCWKARLGYFYMDAKAPQKQKQGYVQDADCSFIMDQDFIEAAKKRYLENGVRASKLPVGKPSDIAWILYTSGSTGLPKGVRISQKNISMHMNVAKVLRLTDRDRQSMLASFSFMSGLLEGFPILYSGGTLIMIPGKIRRDWKQIVEFWREQRITVGFVPSHFAEKIVKDNPKLPDFRAMLTGGEPVHHLVKRDFDVFCCYGSSECGGPVSCCNANYPAENYPIGKPIPMIEIYLLSENSDEILDAPGEIGEICAAGPQISMGYLNKKELTEEKFRKNPFSDDPEFSVLYHTGDLGRRDENGEIYYVGRADLMCKIKSFRIEIGAVEATMMKFPGIERSVVKPFFNPGGEKELHGFYYSGEEIDCEELRTFLRNSLLHYMVPVEFHRLEHLDLTENGKVNRKTVSLAGYTEA